MRRLSLILGALAYVGVPVLVLAAMEAAAADMRASQGWVCGTPLVALGNLGALACGSLSATSLAAGIVAYRRMPTPRRRSRLVELFMLGLPFLVVTTVATFIARNEVQW